MTQHPQGDSTSNGGRSSAARRWLVVTALLPALTAMVWLVTRAAWFWNRDPALQFGWIVLLLCVYLIWEASSCLPSVQFQWRAGACVAIALGLLVLFYGQLYQAAFGITTEGVSAVGLGAVLVAGGNLHYVFGRGGLRQFAFPLLLLFVAVPIPETIYYPLVAKLQSCVAGVNVELLKLVGIPAQRSGSVIHLAGCAVGVDEACSGIRSLQSSIMATLFIGYLTQRRNYLRVVLVIAGVGIAIAGNLLRSFWLSYTASQQGLEALKGVHDTAGWSVLVFTAAGVGGLAWVLSRLELSFDRAVDRRSALPQPPASAQRDLA